MSLRVYEVKQEGKKLKTRPRNASWARRNSTGQELVIRWKLYWIASTQAGS